MKPVFLDTSYLIALIVERDEHNERALQLRTEIGHIGLLTSELVLTEFLNHFSDYGTFWRKFATDTISSIQRNSQTKIISFSQIHFEKTFSLYRRRQDKGYSLTDCSSMLIMKEKGIRTILSTDHHFVQEGFHVPMLEN